jgi:glucokinase
MSRRTPKSAQLTIGIDVGGTKVYSILVDSQNRILARTKKKTKEGTPPIVLERIETCVQDLLKASGAAASDIAALGIGFPGPLDPRKGIVMEATNLPGWNHFPLTQEVTAHLGIPSYLDNDVNLGTLGEAKAGAGNGAENVFGVFLGTGTGGGLVLGGQLYHGKSGTAGEVGHMIIHHGGRMGPRGLRGSVEGLTSRTAIVQQIVERIENGEKSMLSDEVKAGRRVRSGTLKKAFAKKDKVVCDVLRDAAEHVGVLVGSILNLLAPDVVVLGGGVMEAVPDAILPRAKEVARHIAVPDAWKHSTIQAAALGDDAGAMGGAILARMKAASPGRG